MIDIDSEAGERWLTGLRLRLGDLPPTMQVQTHRGRHLWFRLSDDCPPLATQSGTEGGPHPGVDIKFSGVVAAPGALHPKGGLYRVQGGLRPVRELPFLPHAVYDDLLRNGGHLRGTAPQRPPTGRGAPATCNNPVSVLGGSLGRLLADTSDGRDPRTLSAVRQLVLAGHPDEVVMATVLAHPLGSKAQEQSDPRRYLQGKIDWCRSQAGSRASGWNLEAFWNAARATGLSASELRVLLALLRWAWFRGTAQRSLDLIGIDSALAPGTVSTVVSDLVRKGWLTVIDSPPPAGADPPDVRADDPAGPGTDSEPHSTRTPHHTVEGSWVRFLSGLARHDGFRRATGSAHSAFPLLCLLSTTPQSRQDLEADLGNSAKTLGRRLDDLKRAGLAVETSEGVAAVSQGHHLDRVAREAGTLGARRKAIETYRRKRQADAEARARWRADATTPGSSLWIRQSREYYLEAVTRPPFALLVAWSQEDGRTAEDLVDYLVACELASHQRPLALWGAAQPGTKPVAA